MTERRKEAKKGGSKEISLDNKGRDDDKETKKWYKEENKKKQERRTK